MITTKRTIYPETLWALPVIAAAVDTWVRAPVSAAGVWTTFDD